VLVFRLQERTKKPIVQTASNPIRSWAEDMDRYFIKKNIYTVSKHIEVTYYH
jgi:hypothetical protein